MFVMVLLRFFVLGLGGWSYSNFLASTVHLQLAETAMSDPKDHFSYGQSFW